MEKTDWAAWFIKQLQASGEAFIWAFSQIEPEKYEQVPPVYPANPGYLGTWVPARLVWHVTEYERCLAIPEMHRWLETSPAEGDRWPDDDATWAKVANRWIEDLIEGFWRVRNQQIELISQFSGADWTTVKETRWGDKPLSMVLTKTFQHTWEHGDTLLRMGLWWDELL